MVQQQSSYHTTSVENAETILLVLPDKSAAAVCRSLITTAYEQVEVLHITTLAQTYRVLQTQPAVMVLLDYQLSGDQTEEVLRYIDQLRAFTPVMLLLDSDFEHAGMAAVQQGACDYLFWDQLEVLLVPCLKIYLNQQRLLHLLNRGEERFRSIINRNADGILVVDQNGIVRFCNPTAEKLFNQPSQSIVGEMFGFPLIVGENTELDILPRGAERTIIVEMRAVEIEWEGVSAYLATLRDVTEQKIAERELRRRERELQALFDSAMDAIIIVNDEGYYLNLNPAACELLGVGRDTFVGHHIAPLMGLLPMSEEFEQQWSALRSRRHHFGEFMIPVPEGQRIVEYQASFSFLPDRNLFFLRDITELRYLEAERIEKERIAVALEKERELRELKDRFLTMMSHELRTPLALIQLSHDMMTQYGNRATEEEKQQYLDNIETQVYHLTEMIKDVMTISRSAGIREEFAPEQVDLVDYCRAIVEEYQSHYYKTHRIQFECRNKFIKATVDKKLLRQALTNLLSNAVKYSPQGGVIQVMLYTEGEEAILKITDHGIGINEEDQKRLFEPFHRGVNVDTIPGTGLGLAIVKQAVTAHEGTVEVNSVINGGSTFILRLPIIYAN